MAPVSFAMTYDKMLREDGVAPSKRKMFEGTRKRKEGKTYAKPFDDTQKKIQAMRQLEASQDDQNSDSPIDPFDEVMGDGRLGCKRLIGVGVSHQKQKDKGMASSSLILPQEAMDSIKSAITAELQKDFNAEREQLAKEREAHAAKVAEMEATSKDDSSNDCVTLDVIASAPAHLRQKDPTLTSEMIAKAIVSSATKDG